MEKVVIFRNSENERRINGWRGERPQSSRCERFEEKIVGKEVNLDEEKNVETLPFGQLESLTLIDLPSLVSICPDSHEIVWPSLRFV